MGGWRGLRDGVTASMRWEDSRPGGKVEPSPQRIATRDDRQTGAQTDKCRISG